MRAELPLRQALPLVAVGGALGALARYGLACAIPVRPGELPWATLLTNLSGCAALGLLTRAVAHQAWVRLFAGTGFLGGFTTFSAFALETDKLIARQCGGIALAYVLASTVGGVAAAAACLPAGRRLAR